MSSPELPGVAAQPTDGWAVRRSLGRCWLSSAASFGLWTIWWLHTYRKLLDGEIGRGRDDATLHTLGMFVPILNYFVVYWLWRDLNEVRVRVGLPPFEVGLYMVGAIFIAPLSYSFANQKLDEYWQVRSQGYVRDAPVTTGEKVVIAVGAGFFLLYIAFILLAILLAAVGASTS